MRWLWIVMLCLGRLAQATPAQPPSAIDPSDMERQYQQARAQETQAARAGQGEIQTGIQWATYGVGLVHSAQQLLHDYTALTGLDETCMNLSPDGAPEVPSSCQGNQTACGKCYTDAVHDLNGMRLNLERLRCYYTAYAAYVKSSIAFGDSASGIHAVTGLAWQNERAGIVEAFNSLKHTYDVKLGQMLPNLRAALEHVGQCESEFMHESDWYQRFGYIYYSFMQDRYKRTD